MTYICAWCGCFAKVDMDSIDSGTTLVCPECQGKTVVDLWRPDERAKFYKRAKESENA